MIPGQLNLPVIWRGTDYPTVTLRWKDVNGDPFNLNGWTPHAKTQDFDFVVAVTDASNGVTTITLPKANSAGLKLGVRGWDWTWEHTTGTPFMWPPLLSGKVEVKQALSTPTT